MLIVTKEHDVTTKTEQHNPDKVPAKAALAGKYRQYPT